FSKRTGKMSGHMCATHYYVWSTNNTLGKGSTGVVYKGLHKTTGDAVAVKTFNQLSHLRAPDIQMREFDVLKKVSHENVVRLLAVEPEFRNINIILQQGTDNKVLIMELCTGGSLFNILDDPENTYGLNEDEFLRVLEHVTAGITHLRDNNIVHRDLKPGNIMKFITLEGRIIYKLTDFGAARELNDDQQFVSLYGTEEYLHPDMYERAVLRKSVTKSFGATVDLWSIGVTLYHVATGFLPFRPYGGRRNKEVMYKITTTKKSGIISGVQVSEGSDIEWSDKLPVSCQLSLYVIWKLIAPLLANLLESDPNKIWSFDKYFSAVTNILQHRPLHIFDVNSGRVIHIFVHCTHNSQNIQRLVEDLSGILPANQMILYKGKVLTAEQLDVKFETTVKSPIFLLSTKDNKLSANESYFLAQFPSFQQCAGLVQDAQTAKILSSSSYCLLRALTSVMNTSKLYPAAAFCILELLRNRMREAQAALKTSESLVEAAKMTTKVFLSTYRFVASVSDIIFSDSMHLLDPSSKQLRDSVVAKEDSNHRVEIQFSEISSKLKPLIKNTLETDILWKSWLELSSQIPDIESSHLAKTTSYVRLMREGWEYLSRDKRALSYNDEQFHTIEKRKLEECSKKLKGIYETSVCASHMASDLLSSWLSLAQVDLYDSAFLCDQLNMFQDMFNSHKESLDQASEIYDQELVKIMQKMNEEFGTNKKLQSEDATENSEQAKKSKIFEVILEKLRQFDEVAHDLKWESLQNKQLAVQIRDFSLPVTHQRMIFKAFPRLVLINLLFMLVALLCAQAQDVQPDSETTAAPTEKPSETFADYFSKGTKSAQDAFQRIGALIGRLHKIIHKFIKKKSNGNETIFPPGNSPVPHSYIKKIDCTYDDVKYRQDDECPREYEHKNAKYFVTKEEQLQCELLPLLGER
uniref:Protein kinase domain-containing protein n=1 Tax=Strigamia maritima TaxID=126957 RepID=T1JDA2_STRMM